MSESPVSRRDFLESSGKAAFGAMIVPRHVLGGVGHQAPSDTLNLAIVGAGGMGAENAQQLGSENIVAVCDVDFARVEQRARERLTDNDGNERPKGRRWMDQLEAANRYADFREMLAAESDLDGVVIATPDHTHAVIAAAAMRAGKHVYVQKPLAWSVHECRVLNRLTSETGVVTQMGNQGHSSDDARRIVEWIRAGVIGNVREVHIWTDRPIWPQGIPAPVHPPEERELGSLSWWPGDFATRVAEAIGGPYQMPETLNWELWRGPVAEDIDWHPIFHPFHWRGWFPFGVGALGDMGAHLLDHPYWALDLGYPTAIEATSTPWGGGSQDPATYPLATNVHYEFPRRGLMPPVDLHWYDGGLMPKRHPMLPADFEFVREGGVIYVGERGLLVHRTYGREPTLYPASLRVEAEAVRPTLARVPEEGHEMNWVRACKGLEEAVSPFEYAAPLTEVMLLGLVALRSGQGRKIQYDAASGRITNHDPANAFLTRAYRPGWEVR